MSQRRTYIHDRHKPLKLEGFQAKVSRSGEVTIIRPGPYDTAEEAIRSHIAYWEESKAFHVAAIARYNSHIAALQALLPEEPETPPSTPREDHHAEEAPPPA